MKSNLAERRAQVEHRQTTGLVAAVDGGRLTIDTDLGRLSARRAKSCLVAPALGDEVVVYLVDERAYVLAVLEGDDEATTLEVDGDLAVRVANGQLSLSAQRGVAMVSGERVAIAAPEVTLHARAGNFVVDRVTWLAKVLHGEVESARLVAGAVDRIAQRVTDRVKRSYRKVEELDQLEAGSIDWEAKQNLSVHCENALVTAEKLVKMDADQIHIG